MKDGDIIAFNGVAYKYCTGGTCLQCSLRNTRLCDHLKCFNGEHFEMLKGVEVIEIPSEGEIESVASKICHEIEKCGIVSGHPISGYMTSACKSMADFFNNKIVK